VAVAALLTNVTVNFARKTIRNVLSFFVALLSFAAVAVLHVPSFFVILAAALLGAATAAFGRKSGAHRGGRQEEQEKDGGSRDA
ncbi:MAG: hypothetical protein K2H09_00285, partial [Treponemataceae bacterium]|nr:hypothetical protein [Treponemataceae bacterium]